MTANALLQIAVYLGALLLLAGPLGVFMARVFEGRAPLGLERILGPVERLLYRAARIDPAREQSWSAYALGMLVFNALGFVLLYALQRLQAVLPLNPADKPAVPAHSAFNAAISFVTNTNWQNYGGETTLSHLVQMAGLTVQNFVSAAMGLAVLAALCRGLARRGSATIGNFWYDLVRSTLYILLPLSIVLALVNVSQGVVQTLDGAQTVQLVEPVVTEDGTRVTVQTIAVGPAASQDAIKQLGTNGGGFYNVNSAHPLENPTPLSNFLQLLAILILPAAACWMFGRMVGDARQGRAVLAAMLLVFLPLLGVAVWAEQAAHPHLDALGADAIASEVQSGGNMEGKEARHGIASSALWATATTAASNGSVNSMHDSYSPLGGLVPMLLMQLGEVIFGGVGSGLYGLLLFAVVAVFVAGLMVGRTPEYLGKKIGPFEMKMAAVAVLVPPFVTLLPTAIAVVTGAGMAAMQEAGPHGLSEALYAFSSQGNNNGSAFAGYGANQPLLNAMGGLAMLFARYWVALPALAVAGSLAAAKKLEPGPGTLPTHDPLFVLVLAGVVIVVGALTFIPALALGPIVEHLLLFG